MTFLRNHAEGILACDFFITVTASFRVLYVFLIMEVGTRRIAHVNVTAHPTAGWALQKFREVITGERPCRFLLHDRDRIYSSEIDSALKTMGLGILKTPFRAPQANTFCERLVGSIRRECLDFLIPLNERHLRGILKEWAAHYNKDRPHASLGPGIPEPWSPSGRKPCPWRSASRISTGGSSGVKSRRKPRTTRFLRSTTVIWSIWPKGSRNSSSAATTGAACIRHSTIDRRRNLRSNRKVEGEIIA
jgi:hypothetical protein